MYGFGGEYEDLMESLTSGIQSYADQKQFETEFGTPFDLLSEYQQTGTLSVIEKPPGSIFGGSSMLVIAGLAVGALALFLILRRRK